MVDPLTLLSLAAFLAAAVYLLNELIAMSMLMMAKRKRRSEIILIEDFEILRV